MINNQGYRGRGRGGGGGSHPRGGGGRGRGGTTSAGSGRMIGQEKSVNKLMELDTDVIDRNGNRGHDGSQAFKVGTRKPPLGQLKSISNGPGIGSYPAKGSSGGAVGAKNHGVTFGFNRLIKFLDLPPDNVLIHIHDDLKDWEAFLNSPLLEDNLLVLVITVIGQKICAEDSLDQQQVNILKPCILSEKFIQKLVGITTDITIGCFPTWNPTRKTGTQVDCSALLVLKNLLRFGCCLFKKMPAMTRDHANLNRIIGLSVSAAGKLGGPDLVQQFEKLRDHVEEMKKSKLLKDESAKRRKREGFNAEDEREFDSWIPPENIRDIPVVPTIKELRTTSEQFLRPNKKSGAYNDGEHYCDVQFRLFREDFVRPLRHGIKSFLENKNDYLRRRKLPPGELRLYKNVTFIKVTKEFDSIVHKLQLAEHSYRKIRWATSKRLLYGSLVILTTEKKSFSEGNTHLGIIFSRNVPELEKGIVTVVWEGCPPAYTEKEYLMFESEVYLESRKHTLETLKHLTLDNFPMKKFIVDAEPDVGAPQYLIGDEKRLKVTLANGQERIILPLVMEEWPTAEEFGLDQNQFAAFQAALTKQFGIIQGPPGTGKTFLGLKIADVLLNNLILWRPRQGQGETTNPITVVCFTNYALDQFLEGVVQLFKTKDMYPDILRIGGSSRSEVMQQFTLAKVRSRKFNRRPQSYSYAERTAKEKINGLEEKRAQGMEQLVNLGNLEGIVNFEKLTNWNALKLQCPRILLDEFRKLDWFGVNDAVFKRDNFQVEGLIRQWFKIKRFPDDSSFLHYHQQHQQQLQRNEDDDNVEGNELYDADELIGDRILDDIMVEAETVERKNVDNTYWTRNAYFFKLSVPGCDTESDIVLQQLNFEAKANVLENRMKIKRLQEQLQIIGNRRKILARIFQLYRADRLGLPNVADIQAKLRAGENGQVKLNELTISQRWALYFAVAEEFRGEIARMVARLENGLSIAKKELQDIVDWGDSHIIRSCQVVGLTTTGAAKYNNLLRRMKSKIVIVEEAAQVFEAQVVTCITRHCEHLIMIGDHRQLQPNPNVFDLATRYNLNLSLFERMLNNDLHCYQLKVQHRMRPEIAELIVGPGNIYEELINAESVTDPDLYPDVRGVTKNVFFVKHSELECSDEDSRSKSNEHEVDFITQLCRYFILQGYGPEQISVLTTYKGQMFNLRHEIRKIPTCTDVRVSSVDDYQGQENDIILVSLVRSNEDGKVGFVKIDNRICVSLSRAKQGLFVIGNMDLMIDNSPTWKLIGEKLEAKGFIGEELEIRCQVHGSKATVKCGKDFMEKAPEGGCTEICNATLPCTHVCIRLCHILNKEPEKHKCEEPCLKKCENDLHPCAGRCYESPCPPCKKQVEKTLKCEWKHKVTLPCYRKVDEVICYQPVKKMLRCNVHEAFLACSKSIYEYDCKATVTKTLPCEHEKEMKCHEDATLAKCRKLEEKVIPTCGHRQEEECWKWSNPENISCQFMVPKKLDYCDHETEVKCCDKDKPTPCQEKCGIGLPCGHTCDKTCHGDDDPDHVAVKCRKPCQKECQHPQEGHKCKSNHHCCLPCPPCKKLVLEILPCGHELRLECHSFTSATYKCMKRCEKTLLCGHPCKNKCFEKCGPCKESVKKIAPCNHNQKVACSEPAKKENCKELVPPRNIPVCGHAAVLFPCKYDDASPEELTNHCTKPCDHKLISANTNGCTHNCKGTCQECLHGRLHVKCQENCGRPLVCGHRCDVPCSRACPPCQKPCQIKCEHSKWPKKKCGDIIPSCKENCGWRCEHKKCTKLCGEMCNREACDEPCPKKLKCGHDCIGFCGEPCPRHCRICDRELLEKEFMTLAVEEDISTARFVFLEDCRPNGHSIEVNALETWLKMSKVGDDGRQEIGMVNCPIHQTPIYNCRRFGNVIRQNYKDVDAVKHKALGNPKISNKLRDSWINKFKIRNQCLEIFPSIYYDIRKLLMDEAPVRRGGGRGGAVAAYRPKTIDEYSMKSLHFIADSITKTAKELQELCSAKKFEKERIKFENVALEYGILYDKMLKRHPLSHQEMLDFNSELDRADLFKQLMMRGAMPTCYPGNHTAYKAYTDANNILESPLPMTPKRKAMFVNILKELDELLESGLGITERERQEIVHAMQLRRGHWFKCPKGHIYAIGDCGGANQQSVCNICRLPIGGVSHQLATGNQLAIEMDGATAPAWPTALLR